MSMNGARAIGPAIAGALVSLAGPTVVFALNAVSFVGIVIVLVTWRKPAVEHTFPAEGAFAALSAGGRFIRRSPIVRRILLRTALFIVPGSALWGLLPVIAKDQLGLSSSGYGLLLGALGVGAVRVRCCCRGCGRASARTCCSPWRRWASPRATVVLALVPYFAAVLVGLVFGGASWLLCLSTLNASMQLSLPAWVRARGLSVYQLIFMGGQALGSLVWGVLAGATSSVVSLLVSAGLLTVCALSALWWPLHARTGNLDLTPSSHWPEPTLIVRARTARRPGFGDDDLSRRAGGRGGVPDGDRRGGPLATTHRRGAVAAVPQRRARAHIRGDVRRPIVGRASAPALHEADRSGPGDRAGGRAVRRPRAGVTPSDRRARCALTVDLASAMLVPATQ